MAVKETLTDPHGGEKSARQNLNKANLLRADGPTPLVIGGFYGEQGRQLAESLGKTLQTRFGFVSPMADISLLEKLRRLHQRLKATNEFLHRHLRHSDSNGSSYGGQTRVGDGAAIGILIGEIIALEKLLRQLFGLGGDQTVMLPTCTQHASMSVLRTFDLAKEFREWLRDHNDDVVIPVDLAQRMNSVLCLLRRAIIAEYVATADHGECKMMTRTNHDRLFLELLCILTDAPPQWDDDKRHEQQIAVAVCEATGMTPERWDNLDKPSREPWIERTITLLAKCSDTFANISQQFHHATPTSEPAVHVNSPRVKLNGPGGHPIVNGVEKDLLTKAQYDVVKALMNAGEDGLSKDELDLKSGHGDARKILKRLAQSDPAWNAVVSLAGKAGRGYRVR